MKNDNAFHLNITLHKFINLWISEDSLSPVARWAYPLYDVPSKVLIEHAFQLYSLIKNFVPNYNPVFIPSLQYIARLISDAYIVNKRFLSRHIREKEEKKCFVMPVFKKEKFLQIDSEYFKSLIRMSNLLDCLKEFIYGAYLHGSLATLDYKKGYSDVDTVIILKTETFKDPKLLLFLRKKLLSSLLFSLQIDPFQHHNHFILTEISLKYYSDFIFPSVIFKHALTISGAQKLSIFPLKKDRVEDKKFDEFFTNLRNIKFKKLRNHHFLKFYVSYMLLFPSYYYQQDNKFYYKKEAIQKFQKENKLQEIGDFINSLTFIRDHWRIRTYGLDRLAMMIPNLFWFQLIRKLNKPKKLERQLLEKSIKQSLHFYVTHERKKN